MFLAKRKGIYQIYYTGLSGKRTSVSTKTKYKSDALKFLSEFSNNLKENYSREFINISLKDFRFEYLNIQKVITHGKQQYVLKPVVTVT